VGKKRARIDSDASYKLTHFLIIIGLRGVGLSKILPCLEKCGIGIDTRPFLPHAYLSCMGQRLARRQARMLRRAGHKSVSTTLEAVTYATTVGFAAGNKYLIFDKNLHNEELLGRSEGLTGRGANTSGNGKENSALNTAARR